MNRKLPVILAGSNCLSGVTSWANHLRVGLADHPLYDVRHLVIGDKPNGQFDICATSIEHALRLIRTLSPAIVVPNYMWSLFLSGLEPGIRCIGMCHADSVVEYYRPLSWYEPVITKFVAVSKECTERLSQCVTNRTEDIETLPYGVHVPKTLERDYQTRPLRLIYAGRVTQPQKRVWDFLPLVENLLRARVPFVFDIVGEGDEFEPLRQIMRARVPAADVHFHPRVSQDQMDAVWSSHDIFVQVSEFEGTSVSMLEAMARGTVPVVTAASSGIAGVINNEKNGFVVPVGDMAAMAETMGRLAKDPSLLQNAGRGAHQTARGYSMELYLEKFVRVLDEVSDFTKEVDLHKRYGYFSPNHPLFVQRDLMAQQMSQLQELQTRSAETGTRQLKYNRDKQRTINRLFKYRLKGWRGSKSRAEPADDRHAA